MTCFFYCYLRHIYAKVINTSQDHANLKYTDFEHNQIDMITNSGRDPIYVLETEKNYKSHIEPSSKFHE